MAHKSVIFEGYLKKESMYIKTLRRRWMVLKNDKRMYSYKQEKHYKNPTEIIDLNSCENVKVLSANKFALIYENNKQRMFVAESRNQVNDWIKHIKSIITQKDNSTDVLLTFEKLINIGFDENISFQAAEMFAGDINKCINFININTKEAKYQNEEKTSIIQLTHEKT
eukprot:218209_1